MEQPVEFSPRELRTAEQPSMARSRGQPVEFSPRELRPITSPPNTMARRQPVDLSPREQSMSTPRNRLHHGKTTETPNNVMMTQDPLKIPRKR